MTDSVNDLREEERRGVGRGVEVRKGEVWGGGGGEGRGGEGKGGGVERW